MQEDIVDDHALTYQIFHYITKIYVMLILDAIKPLSLKLKIA